MQDAAAADQTVHRALADRRRARILTELETEAGGLDAQELARRVGVHPNTARWHLGVLADAGLVRSRPERTERPGRPRILYEPSGEPARTARDEYRLLATVLAGVAGRAHVDVETAGRAWGRTLTEPLPASSSDEDAVAAASAVLAEHGFAPVVDGRTIEMHRCPFHDLAEAEPAVVCGVHRGLVDGTLEAAGSLLRVGELEVYPVPDVCRLHLERA